MRPLTPSLMPPGIDDQKDKDDKAKNQQDNRAWFVVPELLDAPGNIFEIHGVLIYTMEFKSETEDLAPREFIKAP
jgi:hypothetical protein